MTSIIRDNPSLAHSFDPHGNTPCHVAVIARSREVVEAILDSGFSADTRNVHKWTPLDEAIALKDPDMVKSVLTRLRLEVKRERKARRSRLLHVLQELPDFSMQLRWELGSPLFGILLRHYAPDDTYTITKVGLKLRVDGMLRGLDHSRHSTLPHWKKGPFSLIVDASTVPVSAALVDYTESTWVDLYAERKAAVKDVDASGSS